MKNFCSMIPGLSLFLGVFLACLPAAGSAPVDKSDWVGMLQTAGKPSAIRFHFEQTGKDITGTAFVPSEKIMIYPISNAHREGDHIAFSSKTDSAEYTFDATIAGSEMNGNMTTGDRKVAFGMMRLAPVDTAKYFGIYRFEDKHCVYIRTWDELGENQLTYFEDGGPAGPLYAVSATSFFSGPSLMTPMPEESKITFLFNRKNEVTGLKWEDRSGKSISAQKVASVSEEEVAFNSGTVPLAGSLVLPQGQGKGPYPAVVFVHGSGPVTRDFMGPLAYVFANHGIAVLSYDKRGNGKSGGDWLEAGFEDLAADALAGIAYLKSRKEIAPARIGLLGISQGGWIVPLAASKSTDVAFAVLISAPAVSPAAQDEARNREEMKIAGSSQEDIDKAMSGYKQQIDGLMSDEGLQWVQGEIQKAKDAGNTKLLSSGGSDNPRFLLWLRGILLYDPLPALEKVKCPVLAVYGELDRGVPVQNNKDTLESTLKKGGNRDVTVVILPKADHALFECETGSASEFPYLHRFVPGFFDTMLQWLHSHSK